MPGLEVSALSAERPFLGLRPFGAADHDYFFGRETQIYALYRLVTRSHFAAVVGSSGSGKSSLVRAGLLPLLKEESRETTGRTWTYEEMRPGDAPLERLVNMLARIATASSPGDEPAIAAGRKDRIAYRLLSSSFGIADALSEIPSIEGRSFVLLVDQFEELFRYSTVGQGRDRAEEARSRDEAAHFVQLILEASRSPSRDIRILLTMRSDFIGDCARFQGLPEAVSAAQFLVPSLDRSQREDVIRRPVSKAQASIDSALVERLLNDSDEELDQLPVLQHCLLRLWERAVPPGDAPLGTGRLITLEDYAAIGGMAGALSQHADEILTKDLPNLIPVVEQVFRALSEFDQQGRITRRALSFSRLQAESGAAEADLGKVVDRFRTDDCSFLTPSLSTTAKLMPSARVDVGHEALLRRWERVSGEPGATGERDDPRAAGWLREERRDGQRYQVLLSIMESEQPGDARIPPEQIERTAKWWAGRPRTEAWAERWGGGREAVDQLIRQSLAFRDEQERRRKDDRDEEERRRKEERVQRKRSRKLLVALGSVCAALIIAGGAGLFLWRQYWLADQAAQVAQSQAEAAGKAMSVAVNAITDSYQHGAVTAGSAMTMLDSIQVATDSIPELTALGVTQKANLLLSISDAMKTLGNNRAAGDLASQAKSVAEKLALAEPNEPKYQKLMYASLFRIADTAVGLDSSQESFKNALVIYESSQSYAKRLSAGDPKDAQLLYNLVFVTNKVGEINLLLRKATDARKQYNDALNVAVNLVTLYPDYGDGRTILASTQVKMSNLLSKLPTPDLNNALDLISSAIATQTELLATHPNDKVVSSNLAGSYRGKGDVLQLMGRKEEALQSYNDVVRIASTLFKGDPSNTSWGVQLANGYIRVGDVLFDQGNLAAAAVQYQMALGLWQDITKKPSASPVWFTRLKATKDRLTKIVEAQQGQPVTPPPPSDSAASDPAN